MEHHIRIFAVYLTAFVIIAAVFFQDAVQAASSDFRSSYVYVSVSGNDRFEGGSSSRAVRTLERAAEIITRKDGGKVLVGAGEYRMDRPVNIRRSRHSQLWACAEYLKCILSGGATAEAAAVIRSDDVTFRGFSITNFKDNGIIIEGASNVEVSENHISFIHSSGWNKAAILIIQHGPRAVVKDNLISNVGYAGIAAAASVDGDLRNIQIKNNQIIDACTSVDDCGAIYVSGRTKYNGGLISNNIIKLSSSGRSLVSAIYLDDNASFFNVEDNAIKGGGSSAFHIHGGENILIIRNKICDDSFNDVLKIQKRGGRIPRNILFRRNVICREVLAKRLIMQVRTSDIKFTIE